MPYGLSFLIQHKNLIGLQSAGREQIFDNLIDLVQGQVEVDQSHLVRLQGHPFPQ